MAAGCLLESARLPLHGWVQPFSEYAAWVITRVQTESGRARWIQRGWFTSLRYLDDQEHRNSKTVIYAPARKLPMPSHTRRERQLAEQT